jgi:hypothetical protein
MTVLVAVSQFSPDRMTYALRTAGDLLKYVRSVRELVREADSRIPVTNVVTQATEIDRTINRELMFAKLCTGFAVLALLTACVGLYGTMSYSVARQVGPIRRREPTPAGSPVRGFSPLASDTEWQSLDTTMRVCFFPLNWLLKNPSIS